MSTQHYQAAVIGSGPAGSAAAYTLAKRGISTCVIDKKTFPREKLCGSMVSGRSEKALRQIFGVGATHEIFTICEDISFYAGDKHLADQNGYIRNYMTMRLDFDHYLHDLAVEAGATPIVGSGLKDIDQDANQITLANGETLTFDFLIGADGVSSSVAKVLYGRAFDPETIGFGLEVEVPRSEATHLSESVSLDLTAAKWGYGWVFPKKNTFTIGVGGVHSRNTDMREKMDAYMAQQGLNPADYKYKGQYIPWGEFRKTPGVGRIMLCGDAAGIVDPISGEGIAYAMLSGHAAANSIATAIEKNAPDSAFDLYLRDYREITSSIRQANFWRHLIFPKIMQWPLRHLFGDAATLQQGYLDILTGDREYNALPRLFLRQVGYGLMRPFRRG